MINGWYLYQHAALPSTPPHEKVNILPIENGSIWKCFGWREPLLVRWTSDWDSKIETNWWYVIKDTPFELSLLKSKRRYEIKKGIKNFIVKQIDPQMHSEDIFRIAKKAFETYPISYRPEIEHDKFINSISKWKYDKVYGAFSVDDSLMYGYACLTYRGRCCDFQVLKTDPQKEKFGLNASLVYSLLTDHEQFIKNGGYICDGARNIVHETSFQDYLEKYFLFRKAYCKLNILYRTHIRFAIAFLYPFRTFISNFSSVTLMKKISAVLLMEEIRRSQVR